MRIRKTTWNGKRARVMVATRAGACGLVMIVSLVRILGHPLTVLPHKAPDLNDVMVMYGISYKGL